VFILDKSVEFVEGFEDKEAENCENKRIDENYGVCDVVEYGAESLPG